MLGLEGRQGECWFLWKTLDSHRSGQFLDFVVIPYPYYRVCSRTMRMSQVDEIKLMRSGP